jgi:hypothetical protein
VSPDDLETQLRRAGRPETPPERLQRAVLSLPRGGSPRIRRPSVFRLGVAAALVLAVLAGASVVATLRNPAFQSVAAVELRGSGAEVAEARIGSPNGPNRPLELSVQHLQPGAEQYFELWSYGEHPPMMLATFMTSMDGSCTIALSIPRTADWQDLVITPRDRADQLLLCSNHGRC